jgi:hypothetical protein
MLCEKQELCIEVGMNLKSYTKYILVENREKLKIDRRKFINMKTLNSNISRVFVCLIYRV